MRGGLLCNVLGIEITALTKGNVATTGLKLF